MRKEEAQYPWLGAGLPHVESDCFCVFSLTKIILDPKVVHRFSKAAFMLTLSGPERPLEAVVNFPGVPTGPSQVLGLPSCCCSVVSVCWGLLMPAVLNALKKKDPPDENQSSFDVKEAKCHFSKE